MQRKLVWKIILIFAIVFCSIAYLYIKKIKFGLDLIGGMHLVLVPDTKDLSQDKAKDAAERALEVIRNRVDDFGVAEPVVHLEGQGENKRIVVQLPGLDDPKRAEKIIGQTALLEFKIVDDDGLNLALEKGPKPGWEILKDKDGNNYLVKKEPEMTGEYLTDAWVSRTDQVGLGMGLGISFSLDSIGGRKFAKITGENVNKKLAIILDGKVKSAPVIRTRIPDGMGIIEGNFTMEEASDLTIVLRAGTLPAPVNIVENKTVGASLGHDAVKRGLIAGFFGAIVVALFMAIYYKFSGFIAILCLAYNMAVILGVLSAFKATLTLPGIAGFILIIGMAIDANVLIFERIKEEIRAGKSIRGAIDSGFKRAFWTIFDSNLTTLIAAFILFHFGTGPVRGFAVVLSIGIFGSMFSALFLGRTVFDIISYRKEAISI
ncbi:TPA: protein translocase subunit SecD [bacterium]|nr:protein translocase subunit SecD [bacterium]